MTKPQTRTLKPKKCKIGKEMFQPVRPFQPTCFEHASEYLRLQRAKKEAQEGKDRRRKIKVMKEKLKTLSDHKKELQTLVNRFVRMRDIQCNCVSCDRPLQGKFDAGHFWSMGGYPSVRFDLENIWGQCVHCNRDLHGNLLPYRTRLIMRIGIKEFDELATRAQSSNKQTIPEIMELKELFKLKIKHYHQ